MTDLSGYLEELIQEYVFKNEDAPDSHGDVYVALHTDDEGNDPDGSEELTASSYSRAQASAEDFEVSGSGPTTVENVEEIVWGNPEEEWGSITHFSIWDGDSDTDNPLTSTVELPSSRFVDEDTDRVSSNPGQLQVNLD